MVWLKLFYGNKSTKNKLKKLEYNIKNIFSNLKFKDREYRYVYWINVDENSTKETAEAMIKLYELLKKRD